MKIKGILVAIIAVLGLYSQVSAQKKPLEPVLGQAQRDSIKEYEVELKALGDSMINATFQYDRMDAAKLFVPTLIKALKVRGSFYYPFDSLIFMKKLQPADQSFRILNWALKFDDGSFGYFGALQFNDPEKLKLVPLYDYSNQIDTDSTLEYISLDNQRWFGALYYDIIEIKYKKKKLYTLLGWDGSQAISDKKLIEVLEIQDGKPVFGLEPYFQFEGKEKNRVIYEFAGNATMTMKYDARNNIIIMDHMVPPNKFSEGFRHTYIPDGTYNYFEYKRGKWIYKEGLFENFKKAIPSAE